MCIHDDILYLDGGAAVSMHTVQAVVTVLPEVIVGNGARGAKHIVAGGTPPQRRVGLLWLTVLWCGGAAYA